MNKKIIYFILLISLLSTACASTKSSSTQAQTAASVQPQATAPQAESSSGSMLLYESEIQPFANRTEWPQKPETTDGQPAYTIQSGVNDDGVWVEGKGYFKGSLDHIYQTLVNPEIMGPTYLTKDIKVDELKQSPVLTTFVMHVKMRYIFSVEFDIGVTIDALYDKEDHIIGYRYSSKKLAGTKFITRIEETLIAKKVDDTWFSVEMQSLNEATMNKEAETRKHPETLFGYWAEEK